MPSRGLLVLFVLTLLLPGTALAVFGARALIQERQLADQEIRQRLESVADNVFREVERELKEWHFSLEQLSRDSPEVSLLPASMRDAFNTAGGAVVVSLSAKGAVPWPRESLLHQLTTDQPLPAETYISPALAHAEASELALDYAAAVPLYERLLAGATTKRHMEVVHRLARTYRKAGRHQDALRLFQQLQTAPGVVGALPASLIGQYEVCAHWAAFDDRAALSTCAFDLYKQLVSGEWQLPKERYSYYSSTARQWLSAARTSGSAVERLMTEESAKGALTNAAETVHASLCAGQSAAPAVRTEVLDDVVVVSRCTHDTKGMSGILFIVGKQWLDTNMWPRVMSTTVGSGYHVSLLDRDNRAVFTSDAGSTDSESAPAVMRDRLGTTHNWRVRAWLRDPETFATVLVTRQRLYVFTLVLVIASLGFGTYLTHRVVNRELQVARLQSEFVSTVSHEFRSPLTAIRQLGEMLVRKRVPEGRLQEYYERITRESERLGRLVENLLDVAQMDAGRKRYDLQRLDTSEWLRRTVSEFQSVRAAQETAVVATIPDSLPAVMADSAALTCAVHNLLDNAIKYSPGTDTVWLEAEGAASRVTIRVRDRGVGITEADKRLMFDKFYRANGEVARQVKGAGLGLSLVQHIVAAHKGQIECDSRPGEGTTFLIHLNTETLSA